MRDYQAELAEDRRRFDSHIVGQTIAKVLTSESKIVLTLANGADLRFLACSDCCDSSWFVESDIDMPADIVGSTLLSWGKVNLSESRIRDSRGADVTYGFNVRTTVGVLHARMSNDHGDSGYYDGILRVVAIVDGETLYPGLEG